MFFKLPCGLMPSNTLSEVSPRRLNVNIYWVTFSLKLDTLSLELREECNINNNEDHWTVLAKYFKSTVSFNLQICLLWPWEYLIYLHVLTWEASDRTRVWTGIVRLQRPATVYATGKVISGYKRLGLVPPHLYPRLLAPSQTCFYFLLASFTLLWDGILPAILLALGATTSSKTHMILW